MPATFYAPECQQKGGNSSAGENVRFFLDSLVAHGEKTVDPCNSYEGKEFATDRRGEISLFAAF